MGLFDGKKSKFEETMDGLLDKAVKSVSDFGDKHFEEAADILNKADAMITGSLENIAEGKEPPQESEIDVSDRKGLPDIESHSKHWDELIDKITDDQLNFKVCPNCQKIMPAESHFCNECGAELPELTAAFRKCPKCGAVNRTLNLKCDQCGADLPLIEAEDEKKDFFTEAKELFEDIKEDVTNSMKGE